MKMKKLLAMLLLMAILASSTLALAVSMEDAMNLSYVKLKGSTYVFKKAGSGKTNVILKKGAVVVKSGTKGKWTKVCYSYDMDTGSREFTAKAYGWIRSKYVKASSFDEAMANSSSPFYHYSAGGQGKSKELPGEGSISLQTVKTTGKVNLRSGGSLSSKKIKTLKKGTKVTLLGPVKCDTRGVYFYKAKEVKSGKIGWISGAYLPKSLASQVKAPGGSSGQEPEAGDLK